MSYHRTSDERFDIVEQVELMITNGSTIREACEWADVSQSAFRRYRAEIAADAAEATAKADRDWLDFIAASEAHHAKAI